jgi:hypothetical protein
MIIAPPPGEMSTGSVTVRPLVPSLCQCCRSDKTPAVLGMAQELAQSGPAFRSQRQLSRQHGAQGAQTFSNVDHSWIAFLM